MSQVQISDLAYISTTYIRHQLAMQGIKTMETQKSLGFGLLTNTLQNLAITSAVMTNHKTKKKETEYNYNFWEFKIPKDMGKYLICICLEKQDKKLIENGYFIFPKELIEKMGTTNTISIFESDLSGNYNREPKINKHKYFKNWKQLKNEN